MASLTPDSSVIYDITEGNTRGRIVSGEQNEVHSSVSSVTSLHAARKWARSTDSEEASLGITCNVAGELANDTESSEAAVAVRQEMKQQEVIEKPEGLIERINKTEVVGAEALFQDEARLDGMTSLECGTGSAEEDRNQSSNVGGGTGPAEFWSPRDFVKSGQKVKLPSATGQSSTFEVTLDTRTSQSEKYDGLRRTLREGMMGINALQLDFVQAQSLPELEQRWLATLAELKKTTFPPRRSQASEVEPEDVKSVSCSSVASSVAAFEFLEFVCDCGSVEEVEFGGNATSCSSLELRSDGSNESVGCTSVRESEHAFPASPPDERPWCGECDNFIESNQELTYCGIPSCRWVLHHNCVRPHYSRRHPLQPIPDGFEM